MVETMVKIKRPLVCFIAAGIAFASTSFSEDAVKPPTAAIIVEDEVMGRLKEPSAVFFDESKKRLYISDSGNKRLVSFDSDFRYLSELSDDKLALPSSLIKTEEGNFYVVDMEKGDLKFVNIKDRSVEPFLLKGLPREGEGFLPGRLAMDARGLLYVIDRLNKRVLVVDGDGNFKRAITVNQDGFSGFTDLRVDDNGNIYAVDTVGKTVYIFDGAGGLITKFQGRGEGALVFPSSIAISKTGLIYVSERHAGVIKVFNRDGALEHVMFKKGIKEGELNMPSFVYIDKGGRLYVVDKNRVQVFKETK